MMEKQKIKDWILCCEIKLKDEVEMKLMEDEKIFHSNVWRTHHKITDGLEKSHGKISSLLFMQCTQVLIDKMKQDTIVKWSVTCLTPLPSSLFKLIE
jgi:hypothetical protein